MKRYKVFINGGAVKAEQFFYSSSRNSRLLLRETGAEHCEIYDMYDRRISAARLLPDGRINVTTFGSL